MRCLIRRRSTRKAFKLPCTSEQAYNMLLGAYKAEVSYRGRTFVDDPTLSGYIKALADFLTSDSTKFGFMLVGKCGNGKTTLLYAFRELLNYLASSEVISTEYTMEIKDAREITTLAKSDYSKIQSLKEKPMLAIEDMGKEPTEVLDYGNVYSPVVDILEYRYTKQLFTAATTNLTSEEIEQKYKERIRDRFREMFLRILFTNKSYR